MACRFNPNCIKLLQDNGAKIEKRVNFYYVCYNIQHPQFHANQRRKTGWIYTFWLYHHRHSAFHLYLTPDYNPPNGHSTNSIKLLTRGGTHRYLTDLNEI